LHGVTHGVELDADRFDVVLGRPTETAGWRNVAAVTVPRKLRRLIMVVAIPNTRSLR